MAVNKKVMGQPTKYRDKYCTEIVEYFESKPRFEIVTEGKYTKDGALLEEKEIKKPLGPPTLYGFAVSIQVCRETLTIWAAAHPEFDKAVRKCKSIQAEFIVLNSMEGISPTAFSIFMMKNNFNWTDRIEQKVDATVTTLENLIGSSFEGDEE